MWKKLLSLLGGQTIKLSKVLWGVGSQTKDLSLTRIPFVSVTSKLEWETKTFSVQSGDVWYQKILWNGCKRSIDWMMVLEKFICFMHQRYQNSSDYT